MFKITNTQAKAEFIAETSRVEAYSDAIIAIIMTLLVFNLKPPELVDGSIFENIQILKAVLSPFVAFIVSFLALAVVWVNHHHFFHALEGIDKRLLWHNNHLLIWVCMVPFVTALAGENLSNPIAIALYGVVMFMMALAFSLTIRYAFFKSDLLPDRVSVQERMKQYKRSLFGPFAYALGIVFALVLPWVSIVLYLLVMLFYFLPQRIEDAVGEAVGA